MPGTAPSTSSSGPRTASKWPCITASVTSSASSPSSSLSDITSTYFEGAGPADFARHGYSRDGKSQNVQVIVGVVMVAGWPIAHRLGRQPHRPFHSSRSHQRFASAVRVRPAGLRRRPGHGHRCEYRVAHPGRAGLPGGGQAAAQPPDRRLARGRGRTKWVTCPGGINTRNGRPTRRAPGLRKSCRAIPLCA